MATIRRIYTEENLTLDSTVNLDKTATNHIVKVLRMRQGETVELFNGDGFSYFATLSHIEKNQVAVSISERQLRDTESPLNIHLYQAVSRGDKMDLTLQKSVELGVKNFTPMITDRCGVKLDQKRWQKKYEHWKKVISSACEQCGRNTIPTLNPIKNIAELYGTLDSNSLFLDPSSGQRLSQAKLNHQAGEIKLLVGSEGGFSEHEFSQIKNSKAQPISIGPRILRTETAALATVSAINVLWGDF